MEASGPAFTIPQQDAFIPTIKIIGAGGGGGNVVSKMADEGRSVRAMSEMRKLNPLKSDQELLNLLKEYNINIIHHLQAS